MKCACTEVFLCSCRENVARKLFLFPSIYRHKLVPFAFSFSNPGITILPRPHLGTQTCFCRLSWKNFACCFLVQSRPNSNVLLSGITRGAGMRLVLNCPALKLDIGPFEDLSVLTKFSIVQQVVRTCFCDCLTKCIERATRTNHKTTASLFF